MKAKLVLISFMITFSQVGLTKIFKCNDGFEFDNQTGKLTIDMNSYTEAQLDSYLYKNYSDRKYYMDNIIYNTFHDAYFKSDTFSTIKIYRYNNGEPAFSLVAARYGYDVKQIKFGNCEVVKCDTADCSFAHLNIE